MDWANIRNRGLRGHFFRALALLLPDRTLLPRRPSLWILPAAARCSYAPRTTLRATWSELASSLSLGNKLPLVRVPESIMLLSWSVICLVSDSDFFLLTRRFIFT